MALTQPTVHVVRLRFTPSGTRSRSYKTKPMAALHETMSELHRGGAFDEATMSEFDQRCLADAARELSYQVFTDAKGEWRWHLEVVNGKRIAGSGEG